MERRVGRSEFAPALLLAVALAVAGCSGSSHHRAAASPTSTNPRFAQSLSYVNCLRKNGVPNMPSPAADGAIMLDPAAGVDPASASYLKAAAACRSLQPKGSQQVGPPPDLKVDVQKYVACMRGNGFPSMPDPDPRGFFQGIDTKSPAFQKAQKACQSYLPAGAPPPS